MSELEIGKFSQQIIPVDDFDIANARSCLNGLVTRVSIEDDRLVDIDTVLAPRSLGPHAELGESLKNKNVSVSGHTVRTKICDNRYPEQKYSFISAGSIVPSLAFVVVGDLKGKSMDTERTNELTFAMHLAGLALWASLILKYETQHVNPRILSALIQSMTLLPPSYGSLGPNEFATFIGDSEYEDALVLTSGPSQIKNAKSTAYTIWDNLGSSQE